MKSLILMIALVAIAACLSACTPSANTNTNTNTNTNAAKPTAAAPTADALLALDKDATEKYFKGDGAAFDTILSDKAVMSMGKDRMGKAGIIAGIKTMKCENVTVNLAEPQMSKIDNDTYVVTYKDSSTGKCTENGKATDLKPMRVSTIWVRNGEKWQAAWHGETPMMGAPADAKKDEGKSGDAAKPAEPKKEDKLSADTPKKEEPKKEEVKKEEPKKDEKPAANSAAEPKPEAPKPSANTEALAKLHAGGWDAFRNKDAKAFDAMMASTYANVGPDGTYTGSKADTIKMWTETMKCEGVTKTSFTDPFAFALSPTVEVLMGKGSADGKCDGHPNGDLWQTAVYVKEGDAWKLAFMFETMPQGGM